MRKRADLLLVERGFFASRARAQAAIEAGLVRADGAPVRKSSDMLASDAAIEAAEAHPWVSRGGVKLAAALDAFGLDPSGLACLDLGASTGGFTDVLLTRGARKIVAVDVGHGQFDRRLAGDPRISLHEGLDARRVSAAIAGGARGDRHRSQLHFATPRAASRFAARRVARLARQPDQAAV